MAEYIDKKKAEKILEKAFKSNCNKSDFNSKLIEHILNGTHKTYKYVLVTALLAKATNEAINPLALQAGAPISGAYDARSLCHDVVVEFERDHLQKALGGSNEPFLNKPARFTHLSNSNAVRRGKDKATLDGLITLLSKIDSSTEATEYLSCALNVLKSRIVAYQELINSKISHEPTLVEIYQFIELFLTKSFEGETSAIIVGSLEEIYHSRQSQDYSVKTHKVNQSGASSNEIGDVDVYKNGVFHHGIEVKDKNFSQYDLEHAMDKIVLAGGVKGQFIYGPNASFDRDKIEERISRYLNDGFMVFISNIFLYSRFMLFKSGIGKREEFIKGIIKTSVEINSKEETKSWIQEVIQEMKWR